MPKSAHSQSDRKVTKLSSPLITLAVLVQTYPPCDSIQIHVCFSELHYITFPFNGFLIRNTISSCSSAEEVFFHLQCDIVSFLHTSNISRLPSFLHMNILIADLEMQQRKIEMVSRAKISVARYKLDINPFLHFGPEINCQ
jgi:hypothetical protein